MIRLIIIALISFPLLVNGQDTTSQDSTYVPVQLDTSENVPSVNLDAKVADSSEIQTVQISDPEILKLVFENINYPDAAFEAKVSGTVIVQFEVDKNGEIQNVEVISERIGYGLEEEAIRAVKATKVTWETSEKDGKVNRKLFQVPINFVMY